MNLHDLVRGLINEDTVNTLPNEPVKGITDNSKKVQEGFLFVAVKGHQSDGHSYLREAIAKGASAIVGEEEKIPGISVPYIKIDNSRKLLGKLCQAFYGDPSKNKIMIGITGTNGKTTTSFLLKQILEQNGLSCSLIGTIKNVVNGEELKALNTTPSSLVLNELLSKSHDDAVIIEVSSHGLSQYRLEGIQFDYCLFTNLSQDHLEYHGSMEKYFEVKSELFKKLKTQGKAIINLDNEWGEKLNNQLKEKGIPVYSIGHSSAAHLKIEKFFSNEARVIVSNQPEKPKEIRVTIPGLHNLYNAVMAFAVAQQMRLPDEKVLAALQNFNGVPGRFELMKHKNGATVVVDYAHTADAIFHCLKTVRDCGAKKIVHVFGFRGDRDPGKREEMVKISSELSEQYILTVDDLNTVPLEEMMETLHKLNGSEKNNGNCVVIPDRTEAITHALKQCTEHDWVVITGKGHETYQQNYSIPTVSDTETVQYLNG